MMLDRVLNSVCLAIFLIMIAVMLYLTFLEAKKINLVPDLDVCGFVSQTEYEHFKRLHRFHGTLSSWTENGTCVYKRDGQICSLWDPLTRTDR